MRSDEEVAVWLFEAEQDIVAAAGLIDLKVYARSAFSSEQAAEKALKALYLARTGMPPPRTHRLDKLAEDLGAPSDLLNMAKLLMGDYTASRCPDTALASPSAMYTEENAGSRLDFARAICQWVNKEIKNG